MQKQTQNLKWHRNYQREDYNGTYTTDEANYIDNLGLFTIEKFDSYNDGTMWMIYKNSTHNVLDCCFTLRDAKSYCQGEL